MRLQSNGQSPSTRQTTEGRSRRMFNIAAVFLVLSFLLFLCQLINFGVFNTSASGPDILPVSIRANSQANYSSDANSLPIPRISENILKQMILDIPATGSPQDRMSTLAVVLSSPVPTMTVNPSRTPISTKSKTSTPTPIFTSTEAFTPSRTSAPTQTPIPTFTSTRTPNPTPTFTKTISSTATYTPIPTRTATQSIPTNTTALPPAATGIAPTDTPTPTPTPTATGIIPTDTATPTPTPTATGIILTDTPTPTPTPTYPPLSCMLASGGISLSGREIGLSISNNGGTLVTITKINVNWLDSPLSQEVAEIILNGVTIINSNDPQPPSIYPDERNWTGAPGDLELAASASKLLVISFQEALQASGYSINITFDNGCVLDESK